MQIQWTQQTSPVGTLYSTPASRGGLYHILDAAGGQGITLCFMPDKQDGYENPVVVDFTCPSVDAAKELAAKLAEYPAYGHVLPVAPE